MLMYGWMVWVEHAPERYDWAVKLMTFGRIDRMKDKIASNIKPGDNVLDLGCGTGTLAVRCIERGATVTGLDAAEYMINESRRRATEAGVSDKLTLIRDSVTQTRKHLPDAQFDAITATMVLGEFPPEYLEYILRDCYRMLKPNGKVLIGDECWPRNWLIRLIYRLTMVVFWIPQFLFLRRPLFPIKDLDGIIARAGFDIKEATPFKGTSFRLVHGQKKPGAAPPQHAAAPEARELSGTEVGR
jgi:ubiquinone/menaquinone biosynthesis C-methylase UbiE